jgi:hypothetical protein
MKVKAAILITVLIFGAFFILPLSSVIKSVRIKKHGVLTEGIVVAKSTGKSSSTITVTFTTPDGNQVTAKAAKGGYVSKGDKVKLWYDPAKPDRIDFGDTIRSNMRAVIIIGLVVLFLIYLFIRKSITDAANKKLMKSGMKIAAEFVEVGRNEKYRMGDKNPWVIKCKWTDNRNNKEYFFVSNDFTIDPAPYLNGRYHIDVYLDPADPGKYYVDTTFMPKGDNTIG